MSLVRSLLEVGAILVPLSGTAKVLLEVTLVPDDI